MKTWRTTYIVGAGPSAGSLDIGRLNPSAMVVGVNDAFFHKPCDVFFSLDHNYVRESLPKLKDVTQPKHVCLMDRVFYSHEFRGCGLTRWRRIYSERPSMDKKTLASGGASDGCSGLVAINLAAQMGARRIILFGYDFRPVYTYFYSDVVMERHHAQSVRNCFRKMAPWYQDQGIEIINANLDSSIDAFELVSHDMVYEMVQRGMC